MNLRRKRHDQKMTQEELAERAGLSARYVGAIERGDVSASVTVLGQIAEALGIEPGDLLLRRSSRKGAEPPRQGLIKARTSFSSTNRCMGSLGDAIKSKRS
jgi:transcriptional regulator with XRE-family HTH domain